MHVLGTISSSIFANPGSFDSIATASVPTATNNIIFDNIPQTYSHLQLRIFTLPSSGGNVGMWFNNNTSSQYQSHQIQGDGANPITNSTGTETYLTRLGLGETTSTSPFVAIIDILDYRNTSKNKVVKSLNGSDNNQANTTFRVGFGSGLWMNTSAITRIDLNAGLTYGAGSTIALYGIKTAVA